MIDTAAIIDRVSKKAEPGAAAEPTEETPEVTAAPEDHYGQLFDALKTGDRTAGIAALKECLEGMSPAAV